MLVKLKFQPGINRESTDFSNEGGWWDCDKVRFRQGYPEKIGGWQKFTSAALLGTTRAIFPWIGLNANQYIGFGTHLKYYIFGSGGYNDITPIRRTSAAGAVTFVAPYSTLNGGITAAATSLTLTSAMNFPSTGGVIRIGTETIRYSGKSGNTLTGLQRGFDTTTAQSHLTGAAVGSSTLLVNDNSNGAFMGDFVTFSGAASLGGNLTAAILNQEYQVTSVLSSNQYTIDARTPSSIASITVSGGLAQQYAFSNASDTGTGGAATVGTYQINAGTDSNVFGSGWGAGTWSRGTWGSPANVSVPGAILRLWTHDNYGEDLFINVRDGGIYYWDRTPSYARATELYTMAGAASAPRVAKQIMVSDNDRHVLAFGCDDEFSAGVQDPLLIRFSSQENFLDWETKPTNTAGSLRVGSGSSIVCAVETKQQVLVFTDVSLHSLQYLGPPFTFGISMLSDNISIVSPNSAVAVDDAVFWMGEGDFFVYDGVVQQLPCTVRDYVFSNINLNQAPKIACGLNVNFGEVWWFYPTADSQENNRYVVYNYQQRIWYYGSMARTAWTHRNVGPRPIAASVDNYIYSHELGNDDGSVNPPVAIPAFIQSSSQDMGEGDSFAFVWRMIPDLTFRNSTGSPQVDMTISMSDFPGADVSQTDDEGVWRTATSPVEQYTKQLYLRLRGRSFALRVSSSLTNVAWRLGSPRIDIRTDGRR